MSLDKPVGSGALLAALPRAAAVGRSQPPVRVRPRVLVVDERPVSQMVTAGMVEHLGYAVSGAADEAEALRALAHEEIAVVLLDCPPHQGDRCATTTAIRRLEGEGRRTPVVAIVAGDNRADDAWCRSTGVDALLTRPVSLQGIEEALAAWTGGADRES